MLFLAVFAGASPAHADVYVIANASSGLSSLSRQQVADIYLGRTRSLGDHPATLYDQPDDQPAREQFFRLLVNMPLPQVNAYWARLSFTGRQSPPHILPDETAILQAVRRTPGAIGYVTAPPNDPSIRVLLRLQE